MSGIRTGRAVIVSFLISIFILIYFGILAFAILNNESNNNQTNNPKNEQRIEKNKITTTYLPLIIFESQYILTFPFYNK